MTPELMPLGRKNAARVREFTGLPIAELFAKARGDWPGVIRTNGKTGNGARYYLHIPTFKRYAARMDAL